MPLAPPPARAPAFSVRRLRILILAALLVGIAAYTAVMFLLVQRLSERFGPQVREDLAWRALRGAQELASRADIGLAVSDRAMVTEAFGVYTEEADVLAIVALDASGAVVAEHGTVPQDRSLFASKPGVLATGQGYLESWAPAVIEGREVGRVAIAVSTQRMTDATALLSSVSWATLIAGLAFLALGGLVVILFTRAVAVRDHQLEDYAQNLSQMVDVRTAQLDARNRGMRLVLDNVAQGFITVDVHGEMAAERSAIVDCWFGAPAPGTTFGALVQPYDPDFTAWFGLGLDAMRDQFLPLDLCLAQLPTRFTAGLRVFGVTYSPIFDGETVASLLLIVSDVTAQIAREREHREQRELLAMFQRITSDRMGVIAFLAEMHGLVDGLSSRADPIVEKRAVHTLKGNAALYGLEGFVELCNETESALAEAGGGLADTQREMLREAWQRVLQNVSSLLGGARREVIEVERAELARLVQYGKQGASGHDVASALELWTQDPVARRLDRLGEYAKALARRIGKGEIAVAIDDPDNVRVDGTRWAPFWSAMVHAVRNAVDHGVEARAAREAAGKSPSGTIAFAVARRPGELVVSISDDGPGIDWDAVRAQAMRHGAPAATRDDLVAMLFADGVSTRDKPSELSGRGVGLAALREAATTLGGAIEVTSTPGRGTHFAFRFPCLDGLVAYARTA